MGMTGTRLELYEIKGKVYKIGTEKQVLAVMTVVADWTRPLVDEMDNCAG